MPKWRINYENKIGRILLPLFILVIVSGLLTAPSVSIAQTVEVKAEQSPGPTPTSTPEAPLTEREKQMSEIIKNLQERVTKLENAQRPATETNIQKPTTETVVAEKQDVPAQTTSNVPAADRRQVTKALS